MFNEFTGYNPQEKLEHLAPSESIITAETEPRERLREFLDSAITNAGSYFRDKKAGLALAAYLLSGCSNHEVPKDQIELKSPGITISNTENTIISRQEAVIRLKNEGENSYWFSEGAPSGPGYLDYYAGNDHEDPRKFSQVVMSDFVAQLHSNGYGLFVHKAGEVADWQVKEGSDVIEKEYPELLNKRQDSETNEHAQAIQENSDTLNSIHSEYRAVTDEEIHEIAGNLANILQSHQKKEVTPAGFAVNEYHEDPNTLHANIEMHDDRVWKYSKDDQAQSYFYSVSPRQIEEALYLYVVRQGELTDRPAQLSHFAIKHLVEGK